MKYRFRFWHVGLFAALAVMGLALLAWPRRDFRLLSDENERKCGRFTTQAEYEALLGPPNSGPHYTEFEALLAGSHYSEFELRSRPVRILCWEERATKLERLIYREGRNATVYVRWLDVCFEEETGKKIGEVAGFHPIYYPALWRQVREWLPGDRWLPPDW
jgi:hypothetical protein